MDRAESQIELVDALSVLWKHKYLILAGTLICMLCVGIISSMQPKIFRVDMLIIPGKLHQLKGNKIDYIDSSHNIKAIIQQGILRQRILAMLEHNGIAKPKRKLNFKVSIPRKTDFIKLSYETPDKEWGLAALDALVAALKDFYADNKKLYFTEWNSRLSKLKSLVTVKNLEEKAAKERIATLQTLQDKAVSPSEPTASQTGAQLAKAASKNQIQSFELTKLLHEAQTDLAFIQQEKKLDLEEIALIEQAKNEFQFIQILKSPKATKNSIKPNIRFNLSVAAIGGILLMILSAFFIEYIRRQLKRSLNRADIQSAEEG